MYNKKRILAIIPARGGSRGIPHKNIKLFAGKPLIYWTICEAKKSKFLDEVIVSTDSLHIADIALKYGASAPFIRPKAISTDNASSLAVVLHAIHFLQKTGRYFEIVILLQPTSPLRRAIDIDNALQALFEKRAKAIVSVAKAFLSPILIHSLPDDKCMKSFVKKSMRNKNRQSLDGNYFQLNGAIFLAYSDYIDQHKDFYGNKTYAYVMPKERSIDIDDMIDFNHAECLMREEIRKKHG
jgi:N-acylneuraminate cytidylyltransferase/CMP-N,N'-diacetyllegionaminic acid synthase